MAVQLNTPSVSAATAVDHVEVEQTEQNPTSAELFVGSGDFLKVPQMAVEKLGIALINRCQQLELHGKQKINATKLSKIWKILFPGTIDKQVVKKIYALAKTGFYLIDYRAKDTSSLKVCARQLHQLRVSHPAEFRTALPGLESRDFVALYNCLEAYANIWDAIDGVQNSDSEAIERNINRLVKHLHKSGLPADDASLNQFCDSFLKIAGTLRLEKQPEAAAAG